MNRILVVEDEDVIRKAVQRLLERHNYEVGTAASVSEAIAETLSSFDLILADLRLPGAEGTDLIREAGSVPVVIMTSHASVRSAVESMKLGAIDYVSKPFDHDELLLVIERSLRHNRLYAQNVAMKQDLNRLFPHDEIISSCPRMQQIIDQVSSPDNGDEHVFLYGERGTGKELLARLSHDSSARSVAPMVFADLPIYDLEMLEQVLLGGAWATDANAATPRQGFVQSANGGTLVIRNIDLLSLDTQQKLHDILTLKQQGPLSRSNRKKRGAVNVRVIALNMTDPNKAIEEGLLDPDLAGLFSNNQLEVPPLRARREDLESMARHYLNIFARRYRRRSIRLSAQALHAVQAYNWPGNVTELKSVMERGALLCDADEITAANLGLGVSDGNDVHHSSRDLNLDGYFRYFVLRHQQSLSETELAQRLGISRKALWERRQKMDLPRP